VVIACVDDTDVLMLRDILEREPLCGPTFCIRARPFEDKRCGGGGK
jgi:hypothetical protein